MLTKIHRSLAVFAATVMVLGVTVWLVAPARAQQASTLKAPTFELDAKWPTIPNNWVLGEVTSISVDRNDHIWVLHVPQSIPEDKRANAAPPVLEFDAAGKLLTSWGGPGDGLRRGPDASTASSSTRTTSSGSAGAPAGRGRPRPASATT